MTRKQALRMAATAKRRRLQQFMMKRPTLAQMADFDLPICISYSNPTGKQNWVRDMFVNERLTLKAGAGNFTHGDVERGPSFATVVFGISNDFEDETPWP